MLFRIVYNHRDFLNQFLDTHTHTHITYNYSNMNFSILYSSANAPTTTAPRSAHTPPSTLPAAPGTVDAAGDGVLAAGDSGEGASGEEVVVSLLFLPASASSLAARALVPLALVKSPSNSEARRPVPLLHGGGVPERVAFVKVMSAHWIEGVGLEFEVCF